jgi:hypothetical protein
MVLLFVLSHEFTYNHIPYAYLVDVDSLMLVILGFVTFNEAVETKALEEVL